MVRFPLQEVINLQVYSGAMKEVISKSIFSDVSSPKPTFRGPELKASHSPHLRPLCRGGFRAEISESSKLASARENTSSYSLACRSYAGWGALGSLGWVWINPFKPKQQIRWALWGCHWRGASKVDRGVQQDCWSQARWSSKAGAHRTGFCEFKKPQAACCPDRCWGSNSMDRFREIVNNTRFLI